MDRRTSSPAGDPEDADAWFVSDDATGSGSDGSDSDGFAPDEFERISLEAAVGPEQEEAVREFWRGHRVVVMSVRGEYAYLAVRQDDGAVVHGAEPEFEETTVVAGSLAELRAQVAGEMPLHPLVARTIPQCPARTSSTPPSS
ncbi:hypothetical protein [Pimelobacter simplex]|uniref:hypothetical protein n=1 Tax=Nocardioides simplex TaxID=2045 RepID=UPI001375B507|nr:hypothetical protein [Pimelobacter simplex]